VCEHPQRDLQLCQFILYDRHHRRNPQQPGMTPETKVFIPPQQWQYPAPAGAFPHPERQGRSQRMRCPLLCVLYTTNRQDDLGAP
jgi:hypothetical protein